MGDGVYTTGIRRFEAMLKAFPKTIFVAHADGFWANIGTNDVDRLGYPTRPIAPGGRSDRLLSDYPNLYGDLAALSGNNAISRDLEFTAGFLQRHRTRLVFGSDCLCTDGHGAQGSIPNGSAALPDPSKAEASFAAVSARLKGKCVGRETLTVLKRQATPEVFRAIAWENAARLFKIRPGAIALGTGPRPRRLG